MIKIILDRDQFFHICWGIDIYKIQPYARYKNSQIVDILMEEVHIWLVDNNIKYKLDREQEGEGDDYFFIIFENKSDAMLFKLTWM